MNYNFECIQIIPDISKESSGPSYSVVKLAENLIDLKLKVTLATLDIGIPKNPPYFLHTFPLSYNSQKLGASLKMKHWLKTKSLIGKKKYSTIMVCGKIILFMLPQQKKYPNQFI